MRTPQDAYHALMVRAQNIATHNYEVQIAQHLKRGRAASTFRFSVSPIQQTLIDMSSAVLDGTITVAEASAFMLRHDVLRERDKGWTPGG